ncbi:hypothetical protein AB0393_28405 [Streptomyces cyaneofuscatus]|uniref:hypothetical protein n=1 Tax=Streptomyces cyaneofuscatus TaxID=66883 RepID=UPI00344D79CB
MTTNTAIATDTHGTDDQVFTADVVALHAKDRSPCPLDGAGEHRHFRGHPLHPHCAALGGRAGYGYHCSCGVVRPCGGKLAAIEGKARHLALHRGDLLVHRVVHDSDGPLVIQERQTLSR